MLHQEKETIANGRRDKGNEALREIAGRINRLSYRDMQVLSAKLAKVVGFAGNGFSEAILKVADELERS